MFAVADSTFIFSPALFSPDCSQVIIAVFSVLLNFIALNNVLREPPEPSQCSHIDNYNYCHLLISNPSDCADELSCQFYKSQMRDDWDDPTTLRFIPKSTTTER